MTDDSDAIEPREYANDRLLFTPDYDGYWVMLTRGQWYAHVLSHKPYMASHLADVEHTLRSPRFVNHDAHPDFPHRACYYGRYTSVNWSLMLKVVVDHHRIPGFVVTAYPCSRPGAGEVRTWTSETP